MCVLTRTKRRLPSQKPWEAFFGIWYLENSKQSQEATITSLKKNNNSKLGKRLDKLKKKPVLAELGNFSSDPCACDLKTRFTNETSGDPSLFSSSSSPTSLPTLHLFPLPPLSPGGQQASDAYTAPDLPPGKPAPFKTQDFGGHSLYFWSFSTLLWTPAFCFFCLCLLIKPTLRRNFKGENL